MASRLRAIQDADRPKMWGRAMISGPSGSGKTWTSLSIATRLVAFEKWLLEHPGDEFPDIATLDTSSVAKADILVIDTEKESALTYADVFKFRHLPWRPPFDAQELDHTLQEIGDTYMVVLLDSFTKFWHGQGGILDLAGGAIGGWKTARPVQEALVETVLGMNAHVILGVRSKMDYLIEGGKGNQTVTKVGLAPMQDDNLVYEMNVAVDIDMGHDITVTKSRTPAVPVGRRYPAGYEKKMAADYAEWLAGGVPPAARDDVDRLVAMFGQIGDKETSIRLKNEFRDTFGMPHSLTAAQMPNATAWLDRELDALNSEPAETAPVDADDANGSSDDTAPPDASDDAVTDTEPCFVCESVDHDTKDCPNPPPEQPEPDREPEQDSLLTT